MFPETFPKLFWKFSVRGTLLQQRVYWNDTHLKSTILKLYTWILFQQMSESPLWKFPPEKNFWQFCPSRKFSKNVSNPVWKFFPTKILLIQVFYVFPEFFLWSTTHTWRCFIFRKKNVYVYSHQTKFMLFKP